MSTNKSTVAATNATVMLPRIESRILVVREQKVIIDADLAVLYDVPTKALNQAVKRNAERFPTDFMFQLSAAEKSEVVTCCDHLQKLKFSKALGQPALDSSWSPVQADRRPDEPTGRPTARDHAMTQQTLPPPICFLSACAMARAVATGRLSSVAVVTAHLERIAALNPKLNALVQVTVDQALAAASLADQAVKRGAALGPLHGVPFTVKDVLM